MLPLGFGRSCFDALVLALKSPKWLALSEALIEAAGTTPKCTTPKCTTPKWLAPLKGARAQSLKELEEKVKKLSKLGDR